MVTDVSFIGVSTQYLVRMPWGQELTVFEQNTGARDAVPRRASRSTCHWRPEHAFLLDARPGRVAPASDRGGRGGVTASARTAPVGRRRPAPPAPSERARRRAAQPATCCCCPGSLWLVVFFVVPLFSLVATSLYDPSGSLEHGLRR